MALTTSKLVAGRGDAAVTRCPPSTATRIGASQPPAPRAASASCGHLRKRSDGRGGGLVASATADAREVNAATTVSKPVVKIDNMRDPFATVVTVEFGDVLGELVDTIRALKNLDLNIKRAKLDNADPSSKHRFYITDSATSEKIVKSSRLEQIRLTILDCLTRYHPESEQMLGMGRGLRLAEPHDLTEPLGPEHRTQVDTTIKIRDDDTGTHSEVFITTRDRPGLLTDIVHVLKDLNVNVVSAEVDTVGTEAQDEFFVTYKGEPLNPPMQELVRNAMQYFLSLAYIESEESY